MSYLPPYLGSYEDIVNWLLHPRPAGPLRFHTHVVQTEADELNPQPLPPGPPPEGTRQGIIIVGGGPDPVPWRNPAVRYLSMLVNMQELGKTVENKQLGQQLARSAEISIQAFLDDFCGTPPRRIPWPWPGPPPWVTPLAAELVSVANTQSGAFREGLMQVAGRVAALGFSAPSAGKGSG